MVHLTRIYTRAGDGGMTRLADNSEIAKADSRVAFLAFVDEAGAALGVALALGAPEAEVAEVVQAVQNDLFDLGADISGSDLHVSQPYVDRLEAWCDRFNADLGPLTSFVLAGGTPAAALLHQARTVARRAERMGWGVSGANPGAINPLALTYLNRLSDLLFILARHANRQVGDILWQPGGHLDR